MPNATQDTQVRKRRAVSASEWDRMKEVIKEIDGGLEKDAITSGDLAGGGKLNPAQAVTGGETSLVLKPFAGFQNFDACVTSQTGKGHTSDEARRICGALMRDTEKGGGGGGGGALILLEQKAAWDAAFINNLPDSAFLYVEDGGKKDDENKTVPRSLRHFPYKDENGKVDLPHLRNAAARIPQSSLPKDVQDRLGREVGRLLAQANKDNGPPIHKAYQGTGVMIGANIPTEVAKGLALDGGEDPKDHHITVAYLGKAEALGEGTIETAHKVLKDMVCDCAKSYSSEGCQAPMKAAVGGVGRFAASESSDGMDVIHAQIDSPELHQFRTKVVSALKAANIPVSEAHGFSPHVTMAYVEPASKCELPAMERKDFQIDQVHFAVGGEKKVYQLGNHAPATVPGQLRESNKSAGGMTFEVGATGEGVIQTHERGLTQGQVQLTKSFGWEPVRLAKEEVAALSALADRDLEPHVEKALEGDTEPLAKQLWPMFEPRRWESIGSRLREVVARAYPVEIHTDLRLKANNQAVFEGGEGLTPGSQYGQNLFANGSEIPLDLDPGDAVMKSDGLKVLQGPAEWLTIGVEKAQAFPPGAPGSTPSSWSRFHVRQTFRWKLTEKSADALTFEFEGGDMTGTWIAKRHINGWRLLCQERSVMKSVFMPIVKASSDEKRLVTGIVLQPETVDAQGDIYNEDVITAAAHQFLADYNAGTKMGFLHKKFDVPLQLVESWVAPVQFMLDSRPIKKGTWLATVHVTDDAVWDQVKKGMITGFSIGGVAKVRPMG